MRNRFEIPTPGYKINKWNHIKSKKTQNKPNKMNKINNELLKALLDVWEMYFKNLFHLYTLYRKYIFYIKNDIFNYVILDVQYLFYTLTFFLFFLAINTQLK